MKIKQSEALMAALRAYFAAIAARDKHYEEHFRLDEQLDRDALDKRDAVHRIFQEIELER
jgi:hypothetical protein